MIQEFYDIALKELYDGTKFAELTQETCKTLQKVKEQQQKKVKEIKVIDNKIE